MNDLTEAPQAEHTLYDLITTVACPSCHVGTGADARCVTRAGKPAREPHGKRFEALEQAAGITQHRAERFRVAEARGLWKTCDPVAEAELLTAYAARFEAQSRAKERTGNVAPTGTGRAPISRPAARTLLATKVRRALGLRGTLTLQHDETPTRVVVWDIHTLQDVYARVGGELALAQVTRTVSDGTTYTVIETTLTTCLPGLATTEITTDWDPATELDGYALSVIRDYATAGARRG